MDLSLQLSSLMCTICDLGKVKSHIWNVDNNNNIYCTVMYVCVCNGKMCARQLVHSLSQFMLALFICMLSYNLSFLKIFYPLLVSLLSSLFFFLKGRYLVLKCFSYYVVLPFGFAHSSGLINCVMLSLLSVGFTYPRCSSSRFDK